MTTWGKILKFFGQVPEDELRWILHRVKQFNANDRQWEFRYKLEVKEQTFENITDMYCEELLMKFLKTRLSRIHGWSLAACCLPKSPELLQLSFHSPDIDADCVFTMWVYDVDALLKACDGQGGCNSDELNWSLKQAIKVAKERRNKVI